MKKKLFLLLSIMFCSSIINAQSGWILQPQGFTTDIVSLCFIDNNTGYGVSGHYTQGVIRTTNGGINWNAVGSFSFGDNLLDVYFFNSLTGIVIGGDDFGQKDPVILRTTNAGNTWVQINLGTAPLLYRGISFQNNIGIIVGNYGTILKSTNGGINWDFKNSGTAFGLRDVCMLPNNIVYAVGNGTILKSTDAGENWISQNANTSDYLYSVFFLNIDTGYAVGGELNGNNTTVLKTTNGGMNWDFMINSSTSFRRLSSVCFTNANTGYITGGSCLFNSGVLCKTTDGGQNWKRQDVPFTWSWLSYVTFVNDSTGFCTGGGTPSCQDWNSVIIKTNKGGDGVPNPPYNLYCTRKNIVNTLLWSDYSYTELGHVIQRRNPNDTSWSIIDTVNFNVLSYADTTGIDSVRYRVYDFNEFGSSLYSNEAVPFIIISTIDQENGIRKECELFQNYPNPFNPVTTISYTLNSTYNIKINIFNIQGKNIKTLVNTKQQAGVYKIDFDAGDNPSGIYFLRLEIDGNLVDTKQLILLK